MDIQGNHTLGLWKTTTLVNDQSFISGLENYHLVTILGTCLTIFLCIFLALAKILIKTSKGVDIRNDEGAKIKELSADSRLDKFVQSISLSTRGKGIAADEPYLIHNGKIKELVITKPDHLRDFYRDDTRHHPKPRNLNMGEYFGRLLGNAVGVQYGQRWRTTRKHFYPEFAYQTSLKAIPKFSLNINQWLESLPYETLKPAAPAGTFVIDVKKPSRLLPFRLVALQLYGEAFNDTLYSAMVEISDLHKLLVRDVLLDKRLIGKLWNLLPTGAKKRMDTYSKKWERLNISVIEFARNNNLDCPAERIYRGVDKAREMKKIEFLHTIDEILFTNIDVTSAVLNTIFNSLAVDQVFQKALRAEISKETSKENSKVEAYIAKQDSLLNFLIMESMRLTPAFAFSLPECTATRKSIGGYNIPANTSVVIDAKRLNADPITWGQDGDTFRPERFKNMPQSKCRYGFMQFGVGASSGRCLGRHLADIIFKLTAITIVEKYKLTVAKGGQDVTSAILFAPN